MSTTKVRRIEPMENHHAIEIAPNGDFSFPNGTITVRFFVYDDDGLLAYSPLVWANVSFGSSMTIEDAELWGDALLMAALVAQRCMPKSIDVKIKDEIAETWQAVDDVCEANGIVK